jgi:hypothetical protein
MYKLLVDPFGREIICQVLEGQEVIIPFDLGNSDYQKYLQWLAEGNKPDPPDPPPDPSTIPPSVEERLQAAETIINLILDEEGE